MLVKDPSLGNEHPHRCDQHNEAEGRTLLSFIVIGNEAGLLGKEGKAWVDPFLLLSLVLGLLEEGQPGILQVNGSQNTQDT